MDFNATIKEFPLVLILGVHMRVLFAFKGYQTMCMYYKSGKGEFVVCNFFLCHKQSHFYLSFQRRTWCLFHMLHDLFLNNWWRSKAHCWKEVASCTNHWDSFTERLYVWRHVLIFMLFSVEIPVYITSFSFVLYRQFELNLKYIFCSIGSRLGEKHMKNEVNLGMYRYLF